MVLVYSEWHENDKAAHITEKYVRYYTDDEFRAIFCLCRELDNKSLAKLEIFVFPYENLI